MSEAAGHILEPPDESRVQRYGRFAMAQIQKREVQRLVANVGLIVIIGTYVHLTTGLFWTVSNWEALSI